MPYRPAPRAAALLLLAGLAATLSAPARAEEPSPGPAGPALAAGIGIAALPTAARPHFEASRPHALAELDAADFAGFPSRPGLLVDAERYFEPTENFGSGHARFLPPPSEHEGFVPGRDRGSLRTGFGWLADIMNGRR